jgi:hypothetical protein
VATVIDSLIVTLGLDPTGFTKGQKDAAQTFLKTRDQVTRTGKEIERSSKSSDEFLGKLQSRALSLFAVFSAGRGIKEFFSDIQKTNVAVGRAANLLGTSASKLHAYMGISEQLGGSAAGTAQSIANLNAQLQQMALTGDSSILPYLRSLGIGLEGKDGKLIKVMDLLPKLAKAFHDMHDPARAAAIGHGMGLSDDLITVLLKGDKALQEYLADMRKLGVITDEQAQHSTALHRAWTRMTQAFETLGRELADRANPGLEDTYNKLTKLFVYANEHRWVDRMVDANERMDADNRKNTEMQYEYLKKRYSDLSTWLGHAGASIATAWHSTLDSLTHWWDTFWDDAVRKLYSINFRDAIKHSFDKALDYVKGSANAVWKAITGKELFGAETDRIVAAQNMASAAGGAVGGVGALMANVAPSANQMDSAKRAISAIESGGNYRALGPVTTSGDRAYGKYQVMGANIPAWTEQYYGTRLTPAQFLMNEDAQEKVFEGRFGGYMSQYGPDNAASMWFSGRPLSQAGNAADVTGTTVPSYVAQFHSRYSAEESRRTKSDLADWWASNPASGLNYGAPTAAEWAAGGSVANDNRSASTSNTVTINGGVNVNVPPGSNGQEIGKGAARGIMGSFSDHINADTSFGG